MDSSIKCFAPEVKTHMITLVDGYVEVLDHYVEQEAEIKGIMNRLRGLVDGEQLLRAMKSPYTSLRLDNVNLPKTLIEEYSGNMSSACWDLVRKFAINLFKWISQDLIEVHIQAVMDWCDERFYSAAFVKHYSILIDELGAVLQHARNNTGDERELIERHDALREASLECLRASTRALRNTVYIIEPSIAAIIANESSYARAENESKTYQRQADDLRAQADNLIWYWCKLKTQRLLNETREPVEKFLKACMEDILDGSIQIKGGIADLKEWMDLKQDPCNPRSYVSLLKTSSELSELEELMSALGVNKCAVYERGKEVLLKAVTNWPVQKATDIVRSEYATLIANLCRLMELREDQLVKPLLFRRGQDIVCNLENMYNRLPNDMKNRKFTEEQELSEAERVIGQEMSRDDYHRLRETLGEEWCAQIRNSLSLKGGDDEIYDLIVEKVRKRLADIRKIREKKETELWEQDRLLEKLRSEYVSLGILAFRKKKEVERQMAEAHKRKTQICDEAEKALLKM